MTPNRWICRVGLALGKARRCVLLQWVCKGHWQSAAGVDAQGEKLEMGELSQALSIAEV